MSKLRIEKLKQGVSSNNDVLVFRNDLGTYQGQSNLVVNTVTVGGNTVNSTVYTGTAYLANNTTYLNGQLASYYANATVVDTAYSNAVSTAATDASTKAGTAYSNAVSYTDTKAGQAYTNAVAYAAANTYVNNTFVQLTETRPVSISNTVGAGNTTITGFANVSTALYVASANAVINSSAVATKSVILDQAAGISAATGQLAWNSTDGTIDIGLLNGVTLQTGQEQHFYAKATEAITNGQAVMFAGAQGDHVLVAVANTAAPGFIPEWIVGVATQDFNTNDYGYVTTFGKVRNLNTSAYANGDILYVSTTVAGGFTTTEPTSPNRKIKIAAVLRAHPSQGTLLVRPTWSDSLSELDDVYITSKANNDVLTYDATNGRWKNTSTPTFGNTTVTDLTVSGNLTVSGTTTYVNTTNLNIGDNVITLNADVGAIAPTENAGIEINRGTSANVQLRWNETSDIWQSTIDGTNYLTLATNTDVSTAYSNAIAYSGNAALAYANAVSYANSTFLKLTGGTMSGAISGVTSLAAANLNITGTVSADILTVSNVAQTQTNLQVDPAGSAFLNAIIYG